MFRIIKFKSVKALNFITWKEKDHINLVGNTKMKPEVMPYSASLLVLRLEL